MAGGGGGMNGCRVPWSLIPKLSVGLGRDELLGDRCKNFGDHPPAAGFAHNTMPHVAELDADIFARFGPFVFL